MKLRNELMENFGILKNGCAGILKNNIRMNIK